MELRSQEVRTLAPENDPLKMGMGWKVEDLSKPQIMVESTFGDSHPGSAHLDQFVKEAVQAVTGYGKAVKKQVQEMTRVLLHLPAVPKPDDTADALAMAITFCHTNGNQLNRYTRRVAGPI